MFDKSYANGDIIPAGWTNFGLGSRGVGDPGVFYHRRLVKDLLDHSGYDPRVRPVRDHKSPVVVKHRMNLYQILEVPTWIIDVEVHRYVVLYPCLDPHPDTNEPMTLENQNCSITFAFPFAQVNEPKQKLVLYLWATQYWRDEFLGWDPKEYGGIESVVLPWEHVWLPDT